MNLLRAIKETWKEFQNPTLKRVRRQHRSVPTRDTTHKTLTPIKKKDVPYIKRTPKTFDVPKTREKVIRMVDPKPKRNRNEYDQEPALQEHINQEMPQDPGERFRMDLSEPKKPQFSLLPELHPDLKQVRWLNLSDLSILSAINTVNAGGVPAWAKFFTGTLNVQGGTLYWNRLPFLFKKEKHAIVKKLYFDPKKPVAIKPIHWELTQKYANIRRKDVEYGLKRLERYQLLSRRIKPPKVTARFSFNKPGVLAVDCFFPSKPWAHKRTVLCCVDVFSRFCMAYVCASKHKDVIAEAFQDFCNLFIRVSGKMPRRLLKDKGSELFGCEDVINRYRTKKDKNVPMFFNSLTGAPVHYVEAVNRDVQRRMEVFARTVRDPADLVEAVCEAMNEQPRPNLKGLTPIQILKLGRKDTESLNRERTYRLEDVEKRQKSLDIGNNVRVLMMDRKSQAKPPLTYKGFQPKWSKTTYTIIKRTRLKGNNLFFRYFLNNNQQQSYYRHELLLLETKDIDDTIPHIPHLKHKLYESRQDPNAEWLPGDE